MMPIDRSCWDYRQLLDAIALKSGLTLAIMAGISLALRRDRVRHPFWHITAGALLAHLLVWLPADHPRDYTLIFVLPAMLAIAMTPAPVAQRLWKT